MSTDAARPLETAAADSPQPVRLSPFEQIRHARQIILAEAKSLEALARRIDTDLCQAVDLVAECRGAVVVTGMGKAGDIGQKISATLRSTGTRSYFLHPAEAVHGDLGMLRAGDVVLVLSQSGETDEVTRLLPFLITAGLPVIAVTARRTSTLARAAAATLELGPLEEACPLGLAPSTSTTAMLALGDALALVASRMRGFQRSDFARLHPAGNLGRLLSTVDHHMRRLSDCRLARQDQSVREVFVCLSRPGRRSGAIMLLDAEGRLSGIFTDSDLARLFESKRDADVDRPIQEVMTARPSTILTGSLLTEAVDIMARRKISELPVVDADHLPVGLLDVTDVVGLLPDQGE